MLIVRETGVKIIFVDGETFSCDGRLMDDKHLGITSPPETHQALRRAATSQRRTMAAMALWIIEQWLRDNGFL